MDTQVEQKTRQTPDSIDFTKITSGVKKRYSSSNQPTVAIVDDDQDTCSAIKWLLSSVELNTKIYHRAKAFLDDPHKEEVSCILLDVRMPGMSGLELHEALKDLEIDDIPIVFLSGHADVQIAVQALKSGAQDFITKPFNAQKLLDSIHSAINIHAEDRLEKEKREKIETLINTLTSRELEVLEGIVSGKRSKEIALDLGITNKTVELYRAKVMEKLKAKSSLELIRMIFHYQIKRGKKRYQFTEF